MRFKLTMALVLAVAIGFLAGTAFADKLICITAPGMGGEKTVNECLAKGEKFAVVDKAGIPRELSDSEVKLLKKTNPNVLNMKAFGVERMKEAPSIAEPPTAP
jgi:hypothetical protein